MTGNRFFAVLSVVVLPASMSAWAGAAGIDTGKLPENPQLQECSAKGMRQMMALADRQASTSAPAGFWQDYAYCASLSGMPSSVLMALRRAEQAGARPTKMDELLRQQAIKLLKAPSPDAAYAPRDCWVSLGIGKGAKRFTSRMLGISVDVPKGWQAEPAPMKDQAGMIVLSPPAYAGLRLYLHRAAGGGFYAAGLRLSSS